VHEVVQVAASVGFGVLVGLAVQYSAKIAHVRNPGYARFVGVVIGLFAMYAAWVWYFWILFGYRAIVLKVLLTEPASLFRGMENIAAQGMWKMFDWQPKGGQLYTVWTLEALMVIGFSVALSASKNATYCEACRRWSKKFDMLLHLPLVETDELRTSLEEERYEGLLSLLGQPCDMNARIDVTVAACPLCTNSNFMTVTHSAVTGKYQGQPVITSKPVVKNLIVPGTVVETLKAAKQTGGIGHSEFIAKKLSRLRTSRTPAEPPADTP